MTSQVIDPALRLEGEIEVPGDKSISHRALLVGAVGRGPMRITGLSPAEDVKSSRRAIEMLGARISQSNSHVQHETCGSRGNCCQILVDSAGWMGLRRPSAPIDVGNSGTTIRLLLGILSGAHPSLDATLTGDPSIRRRPMSRVVDPLRAMGALIEGQDGGQHAPLHVRGASLHGVAHHLPVASAQVKSALILAGLRADGETSVWEPTRSRDHTERMLRYLGVDVAESTGRLIVKSTSIPNGDIQVPGDMSSAAFLLVGAAIIPGSRVTVSNVGLNPGRTGILDILRAFGAVVEVESVRERCGEPVGTVTVAAGDRRPVDVSGSVAVSAIDELPLVAVLGAVAEGTTVVHDASELRVKESDRIAAIVDGLSRMGARAEALPDGFTVHPGRLRGARTNPRGDHRIAMALAVLGLVAEGPTEIEDWECVGVSYPGFDRALESLVVR